jgi:hypothetical protein
MVEITFGLAPLGAVIPAIPDAGAGVRRGGNHRVEEHNSSVVRVVVADRVRGRRVAHDEGMSTRLDMCSGLVVLSDVLVELLGDGFTGKQP